MKIVVDIELEAGSPFQEEFLRDSLRMIIEGWASYGRTSHKKNRIGYSIRAI
jgi:hypothetical protein